MAITLRAFLEDSRRPAGTLRYHELQGFLFAVASSPELIKPSEWMPIVFGGAEPEHGSIDEGRVVIGELTALYNDVNSTILTGPVALPADCTFRTELLANLDNASPVSQWSRGFIQLMRPSDTPVVLGDPTRATSGLKMSGMRMCRQNSMTSLLRCS